MKVIHKKKILIYLRYYLPGYGSGGPAVSISNMVQAMSHRYEFYVVCLSNDYGEKKPYKNVSGLSWKNFGEAKVLHLNKYKSPFASYLSIIQKLEPDIVYFNSFLDPFFTYIQLWYYQKKEIKCIIAPRGELTPGALTITPLKKRLYIYIFTKSFMLKKINWHATSKNELNQISSNIRINPKKIFVAKNIPFFDQTKYKFNQPYKEFNKLKIVFLSRITPVKNLMYILGVLKFCDSDIIFDIYGAIDEKKYWDQCKIKINSLPKNISVNYFGPIAHELVHQTLSDYHLFFLPTLGENFGHAIFEALSIGVPVLISDQTPWTDVVNNSNYAAISLNNQKKYVAFIKHLSKMDNDELINLKNHAAKVFKKYIGSDNYITSYNELF
jgi:glycosyltransferase involved in cell wall biosynthesis